MAKKDQESEIDHRLIALQIVDLFFPADEKDQDGNDEKILGLLEQLDPVDAAAVAVQVCYELAPEEIAEFLELLGGTADEEGGPDDEPPEEEDGN